MDTLKIDKYFIAYVNILFQNILKTSGLVW